ncbi:MAG TPA: DUF4845 domain-containing protein [Chromatiales bacterium]|nr:DUF4845 domain-containing protein [Chromatiales bacterium]
MKSIDNQRGMTTIGWILVLLLIAFFAMTVMKLVPVYLNGFKVASIVDSLKKDREVSSMSNRQILSKLSKRFDIDMVSGVEPEDIYIEKGQGVKIITVDYEVRKNFLGNIDFVISFVESVEVPSN